MDLTEEEVRPLLSLKDKAEIKEGQWFNSPEKFEEATNAAMEAQRKIIVEGVYAIPGLQPGTSHGPSSLAPCFRL